MQHVIGIDVALYLGNQGNFYDKSNEDSLKVILFHT